MIKVMTVVHMWFETWSQKNNPKWLRWWWPPLWFEQTTQTQKNGEVVNVFHESKKVMVTISTMMLTIWRKKPKPSGVTARIDCCVSRQGYKISSKAVFKMFKMHRVPLRSRYIKWTFLYRLTKHCVVKSGWKCSYWSNTRALVSEHLISREWQTQWELFVCVCESILKEIRMHMSTQHAAA